MHGWKVHILKPMVYRADGDKGKMVLVEPYVSGFAKFNSGNGWREEGCFKWNKILQALSHFSYELSEGKCLLGNLKGGINREDKSIVLSNPCMFSMEKGLYGCTDIGKEGIINFFKHHECNSICHKMRVPKKESDKVVAKKILFRPLKSSLYN